MRVVACLFGLAILAVPAAAQITYSIDAQGPTNGLPSGGVGPEIIDEGDILVPTPPVGPPPPPTVAIPSGLGVGTLGIIPTAPGPAGFQELDALAYGDDDVIIQNATFPYYYYFSVDEFAVGLPGAPLPPNVTSEGAFGALEASADVYVFDPNPPPPFAPPPPIGPALVYGNTGIYDGNGGLTPFASPTLNLVEPNPPSLGFTPDPGDNLDALDIDTPMEDGFGVFFSLDSAFVDPYEGAPYNTGTAVANGFVGGDVLLTLPPGGAPVLYAAAPLLGLDLVAGAGPDSDDLDALILNDMTDGLMGVYTPTTGPYSWLGPEPTDMLLYSVRRDSAVIGTLDAIFGLAIEPGDILIPVEVVPGVFVPGIWIAAEALGLSTVRSGALLYGPGDWGDDLDALDVTQQLIPEPATSVLLAVSGLVLLGARRRMN